MWVRGVLDMFGAQTSGNALLMCSSSLLTWSEQHIYEEMLEALLVRCLHIQKWISELFYSGKCKVLVFLKV